MYVFEFLPYLIMLTAFAVGNFCLTRYIHTNRHNLTLEELRRLMVWPLIFVFTFFLLFLVGLDHYGA